MRAIWKSCKRPPIEGTEESFSLSKTHLSNLLCEK